MVIQRGEVWWADLPDPHGSEPGFRRPLLVVQADAFNRSRIQTIIAAAITSNVKLVDAPGNVLLPRKVSGLPKDSVVNVFQIVTVDRDVLAERAGRVPPETLQAIDRGLRIVLEL